MSHYSNNVLMIIGMFSLLLFLPITVCAQPLGILSPQPQKKSQLGLLSAENGRFVFGQISDSSKDKFMLDTFTGRLWRIAESGEIGLYLTTIPYRTKKGKYTALPDKISDSELSEIEKR